MNMYAFMHSPDICPIFALIDYSTFFYLIIMLVKNNPYFVKISRIFFQDAVQNTVPVKKANKNGGVFKT